ncbi:DUF2975 domain-containing protein [Virgibacillus sp. MSP4-1]|uniref:DUF2975 domain-containing protein n=1 Tax=Virgibacillus sp. MSP4-1 TaxID=2700081 RepID=UPI0003A54EE2|nr:DUF2975 domain-containing protein [Virgibacillus sp. MSP4-1]QHS23810.1 DUF2975 domain-containing protein [Virgibacillus sp. MSP4-1]
MKQGATLFLKAIIFIIGVTVLVLCVFALPQLASYTAGMYPEYAYLQYPVLIGLYGTVIPFLVALYQALQLLKFIDQNYAFTDRSASALIYIKYCAVTISISYASGALFLMTQSALHPGIAIIGLVIIFTSLVIAIFAGVLQKLLKNALNLKKENDLTV